MAQKLTIAGIAAGVLMTASAALAQGYPERQITMVIPFAAGGPTDTVGRLIAERMSADLGQQVIVVGQPDAVEVDEGLVVGDGIGHVGS